MSTREMQHELECIMESVDAVQSRIDRLLQSIRASRHYNRTTVRAAAGMLSTARSGLPLAALDVSLDLLRMSEKGETAVVKEVPYAAVG